MKLTLATMYNFCPDLFDKLVLPEGLDHDTLVQNLVMDCGEFGVLYADGDYFKSILGWWSEKEKTVWEKLYKTQLFEYDPISNYDRTDEIQRDVTGEATNSETAFDSKTLQTTSGSDSKGAEKVKSRSYGNIGVTTTQQMIEQERRVAEFNTYNFIINSFRTKFCIELY